MDVDAHVEEEREPEVKPKILLMGPKRCHTCRLNAVPPTCAMVDPLDRVFNPPTHPLCVLRPPYPCNLYVFCVSPRRFTLIRFLPIPVIAIALSVCLDRSGKSSIQRVVFQKMSPHETMFLVSLHVQIYVMYSRRDLMPSQLCLCMPVNQARGGDA